MDCLGWWLAVEKQGYWEHSRLILDLVNLLHLLGCLPSLLRVFMHLRQGSGRVATMGKMGEHKDALCG